MIEIILSTLAGLLSGTLGAMGLGGGGVLIIYLSVFKGLDQINAQGINLLFFLPAALLALIIYTKRKEIEFKKILPIIVFGVIGTLISSIAVNLFDQQLIRKIFGFIILAYGIIMLFSKEKN